MPDYFQVELIQLVKFFLAVRPNLLADLTPCLTILGTFKVSVMTAFSIKEEFSVLKCLKTFKIIFLSPELIALPLIAVGLLYTRDSITFPFYFIVS